MTRLPEIVRWLSMRPSEERLSRLEDAILLLADLRDPAARQLPVVGIGPRPKLVNRAEEALWRIAVEIRAERGA